MSDLQSTCDILGFHRGPTEVFSWDVEWRRLMLVLLKFQDNPSSRVKTKTASLNASWTALLLRMGAASCLGTSVAQPSQPCHHHRTVKTSQITCYILSLSGESQPAKESAVLQLRKDWSA